MNFFDKDAAKESFLALARTKPALQGIADGQLMEMLATHLCLTSEAALFSADRNFQESYLASALNRTSILAASYDRNYIPRKASPSKGAIRVVNNSSHDKSIPFGTILLSEDQVPYETIIPIVVGARKNALISCEQLERKTLNFTVSNVEAYYEILLEPELSRQVHQMRVFVNDEEWKETRLFRNTKADSKVWAEIYTPLDQLGVRFGNGIFGKILAEGSQVKLELVLTRGDVTLLNEQPLNPVDINNNFQDLEFITGTVINGGENIEGTEETRRNALYYFLYDEKHEWDDDYEFMLRQQFPHLLFCKVWGEEKQEKMVGYRAVEHINHLFFSVYAKEQPNIHQNVQNTLETIPEYNRFFKHVPIEHKKFSARIEGKINRGLALHEVEKTIRNLLTKYYGQNSKDRREHALIRDLYQLMNRISYNHIYAFESQDDVFITLSGQKEPKMLYDMVSIDMNQLELVLEYA